MARTWLETLRGSKTSSAPRSSTASDPPSTRKAALGSRLAMTVFAAKRDVVIQIDPPAARDMLETETSLLLDQSGFRNPADLIGTAPAVEAQHVFQRQPKHGHLHREPRAGAPGLGPDGFPAADALEHVSHMPIVGEVVEGPLQRGLCGDPRREFQSRHQSKICVWSPGMADESRSKPRSRSPRSSAAPGCATHMRSRSAASPWASFSSETTPSAQGRSCCCASGGRR